ncbi:MAG: phosphoglucosamine mutase [Actinobacteria bacterium]|nr:MAG: phosphoglucosamine mutase [Actinomycetota bacterium]TMK19219.1 MAG: phosphoglucosamine mutase [Actinomycetota bacterium]TMK92421.1 MAG: phosphoglucosamine mutase [Actinomycetota bacterium]TMM22295.1 MAG: phosphoglucosamine mutase [Actinomycetota bacterium]
MGRLFGTDGVRGVAGTDLTRDLAYRLGRTAVAVLGRHGATQPPTFVVGRDTRESGAWLEEALTEGILEAGGDVLLAGIEPTPAIAFMTVDLEASSGVVISASHNPPADNGIKFFSREGMKLPDHLEDEIEADLARVDPLRTVRGAVARIPEGRERYLHHLEAAADARLDGMKIVVDCANGAASDVAPEILRRLGAEVIAINAEPDGHNINVGCGALHPDVVAAEVIERGADAGVTHDGDADRALFADAKGEVIDGDQVLAASALAMHERGTLKGDVVVGTVMSNLGLVHRMRDAGIELVQAQVGDRYVLEEMERRGAMLGGEQSGHVIFREHATTGDGLLTAVRFLSLAAANGVSVKELASAMPRHPQVLINVPISDRGASLDAASVERAIALAEAALGDRGRVLVRPSGTEPLIRVMVESETEADSQRHAEAVADAVRIALG